MQNRRNHSSVYSEICSNRNSESIVCQLKMRDGGCYMYSDAVINDEVHGQMVCNVEDIRRWMGDFTASKNVPKLMSRMGQCFTQAQVNNIIPSAYFLLFYTRFLTFNSLFFDFLFFHFFFRSSFVSYFLISISHEIPHQLLIITFPSLFIIQHIM